MSFESDRAARFDKQAEQLEHSAEYNMTIAGRWSQGRQIENNRKISLARDLRDRADELRANLRDRAETGYDDGPADRETQHARYLDAGPQAWDDQ